MEQKDKTRKEELLKDFEDTWKLKQDRLLTSREGRELLPSHYEVEKKAAMQFILPEYYSEVEKAFDAVPSRAWVGEKEWEKAFLNIAKEKLADTYVFFKKLNDVDQKLLHVSTYSQFLATRDTNRWRDAFLDRLFRIAKKYDEDPVRSSLSDEHIYSVALQASLLDHAGVIDKYKETGRADVLIWDAAKVSARVREDKELNWLNVDHDNEDLKALYFVAAMTHDYRIGKIQEAMYPEHYLVNKLEEASRHDFEYLDKEYDHDNNKFCDRIATLMDYSQQSFTPVFPNLKALEESAGPHSLNPILGSILKTAKDRDEKLLQDPVFVKTHPEMAKTIQQRLRDFKPEELALLKYGEKVMETANSFLTTYYLNTEMSNEEKAEVKDQMDGFEELYNRFSTEFEPEKYGYASLPKALQDNPLKSSWQKTSVNTEPSKPTGQKTSDATKPSRPTGCLHKNDPKTRGR